MKTKKIAFDVDFIGDQTALTIKEEKALSAYFKQKKESLKVAEIRNPIKKSKTVTK